jgi:hypothetical protein
MEAYVGQGDSRADAAEGNRFAKQAGVRELGEVVADILGGTCVPVLFVGGTVGMTE